MSYNITFSVKNTRIEDWLEFKRRTSSGMGTSNAIMSLIRDDNDRARMKLASYYQVPEND